MSLHFKLFSIFCDKIDHFVGIFGAKFKRSQDFSSQMNTPCKHAENGPMGKAKCPQFKNFQIFSTIFLREYPTQKKMNPKNSKNFDIVFPERIKLINWKTIKGGVIWRMLITLIMKREICGCSYSPKHSEIPLSYCKRPTIEKTHDFRTFWGTQKKTKEILYPCRHSASNFL